MTLGLPVSQLINVSVVLTPTGAQFANLNSMLILGSSNIIDVTTRLRSYSSLAAIATDFGTSAPEYLAASLWFGQSPAPTTLLVGRWAQTATSGQLYGAPLTTAQQAIANFTSISNGSFNVSINGTAKTITGLNFTSGVTNLNGVATVIQTALNTAVAGTTCVWNAAYANFIITSPTTGTTSTISFATATGSGTDMSVQLGLTATSSGAYLANGVAAETALAAVALLDNQFSNQWYGLALVSAAAADADQLAIAAYINGTTANASHFFAITTQSAGTLLSTSTTDLAYQLSVLGYSRTMIQYSSANAYAVISAMARILVTDWTQPNSTITLMYKQEPGVTPETLSVSQSTTIQNKNCNVYVVYNNATNIIQYGVCTNGTFVDTQVGLDWLSNQIQTNVYNVLYTTPTKVPQTDSGMNVLVNAMTQACLAGVNNGLIGPGTWNSNGFGQLATGQFLQKGFYIYQPPLSSQAQSARAARQSVPFQIAVKLAGAVHAVNISVLVNQ